MINKKATVAKVTLAGLLLSFAPSMQAMSLVPSYETVVSTSKKAAYLIGFLSLVRFFSRKPDNKPARYNLDELAAGENIKNNLFYLYDDGLLGHMKESSVLKANPENDNKIEVTETINQKGLLGTAALYAKPVAMALAIMELIRTNGNLCRLFNEYKDKVATDGGKAFFAFIGALVAAKAVAN
jgi:hypothetical protein